MENGVFPQDSAKYSEYMAQLKMQNIKMYIELSQVGNATTVGEEALQYYAYSTLKADEVRFCNFFSKSTVNCSRLYCAKFSPNSHICCCASLVKTL